MHQRLVHQRRHRAGGAHAALALVVARLDEDALVGVLDGPAQQAGEAVAGLRLGRRHRVEDGIDGHLGGHLARGGAAHPVADQQRAPLSPSLNLKGLAWLSRTDPARDVGDQEVVLVVLADKPDVGLAEDLIEMSGGAGHRADVRPYPISNRKSSSPNRIRSPEDEAVLARAGAGTFRWSSPGPPACPRPLR